LDIILDGSSTGSISRKKQDGRIDAAGAAKFLAKHVTAKIIVVIDMHCMQESGLFIWSGDKPETFQSCTLGMVCVMLLQMVTTPHLLCIAP